MKEDKVKVSFFSDDFNIALSTIARKEDAYKAMEDFENVVLNYVQIKGRLNDYDSNKMAFIIKKSSIGAIEIMELNSEF